MNRHTLFLILFTFFHGVYAQSDAAYEQLADASNIKLGWDTLSDVDFEFEYNETEEVYFLKALFGEKIKSYAGQKISITGFFLNIAGDGELLLVSRNPMSSCFYCGAAGPESVVEINFIEKPSFVTDQIVTITGILELNDTDGDHFNYILNEATGKLDDR